MAGRDVPEPGTVTATSVDGTRIVASVGGDGPPIVLVHGTSGSDMSWARVRPHLEDRHTVFAMQRRGRGLSGDGPDYSFERESEDVAALVDRSGGPVGLVGHSFGAVCCLAATGLTPNVARLVLYEPVFGLEPDRATLERLDALVGSGRGGEAVAVFLRDAGLTEEEIDGIRSSPTWPERVEAAHTLSREERAAASYSPSPDLLALMEVPTLLLVGSESPPAFLGVAERLRTLLPDGTIQVLEGQGHAANMTAPELLAAKIASFVDA